MFVGASTPPRPGGSDVFDPRLQGLIWERQPGLSSIVSASGLLAIVISTRAPRRLDRYVGCIAALTVAASFALTGRLTRALHARAIQALLVLHVGLAAHWLGAVVGLYATVRHEELPSLTSAT